MFRLTFLVAVDEIESKQPGIFGPNGGYSRALSISSMGWTLGSFIGPLLSGVLVEEGGYYAMCCVLGTLPIFHHTMTVTNIPSAYLLGIIDQRLCESECYLGSW